MPFPNRRPTKVRNLSEYEKGCIVCSIDGEGTVTISQKIRKQRYSWGEKPKNRKKYQMFIPMISITNTNKEFCNQMKTMIGSGYITRNKARPEDNKKEYFRYSLENLADIEKLLTQIIDKFIVKRKQAEILLNYCSLRLDKLALHKGRIDLARYGEEEREMVKQIRELNRRGLR